MGARPLEATLAQLTGKDPKARNLALLDLPVSGRGSPDAARAVLKLITEEDLNERAVFDAIRALQPEICALLPALLTELQDESGVVRAAAAELLGLRESFLLDRTTRGPEVEVALVHALEDPETEVRREACAALGGMREAGELVRPALVRRLADESGEIRRTAIHALSGRLAQTPDSVLPIVPLLEDADARTRRTAALRIAKMCIPHPETMEVRVGGDRERGDGSRTVREALVGFLNEKSVPCVFAVLKALARLPSLTPAEATAVRALREHEDPDVRALARVTTEGL